MSVDLQEDTQQDVREEAAPVLDYKVLVEVLSRNEAFQEFLNVAGSLAAEKILFHKCGAKTHFDFYEDSYASRKLHALINDFGAWREDE